MQHTDLFDSRDLRCKTPYGAVPSGTTVQLTLRPYRTSAFSRAILTARFESRPRDEVVHIFLPWTGLDGDRDLFSGALPTEDYVGLVWYSFRLESLLIISLTASCMTWGFTGLAVWDEIGRAHV